MADESLLEEIQADIEDILIGIEDDGLLLYARHKVTLVTEQVTGRNALAGVPGHTELIKNVMKPSPMVEINTAMSEDFGVIMKEGNAKVSRILSSRYSRAQLEGASYWLIDDSPYTLVEGSLKEDRNGFYWSLVLVRKQNNRRTAV